MSGSRDGRIRPSAFVPPSSAARIIRAALTAVLFGSACGTSHPDFSHVDEGGDDLGSASEGSSTAPTIDDDRPVITAESAPPPISGGTLMVTNDGRFAVAADPDRNLVHIVDLDRAMPLHTLDLEPWDEPGRVAEDAQGLVYVLLRGGGGYVVIDPVEGEIVQRRIGVCNGPRGLAIDGDAVVVACRHGDLVTLSLAGEELERIAIGPDLRDVVVAGGKRVITRFRSAEVIHADRWTTTIPNGRSTASRELRSNTAWRTIALPDGRIAILHQMSDHSIVDDPNGWAVANGCDVVRPAITLLDEFGTATRLGPFADVGPAVDFAIAGDRVIVAMPGHSDALSPFHGRAVMLMDMSQSEDGSRPIDVCGESVTAHLVDDDVQVTAVAFAPNGDALAFSREPPLLLLTSAETGAVQSITLTGESREDTGHALFHTTTATNVACMSCHPEGEDDGLVWTVRGEHHRIRHTPSLLVGLRGTAPFHWDGEFADGVALVNEVRQARMNGDALSPARERALADYFQNLRPSTGPRSVDDEAAQRGAKLFTATGCATCHAGSRRTNNAMIEPTGEASLDQVASGGSVVAGPLQVPTLVGVASHPPYMHDGRADDLYEAALDMLDWIPVEVELEAREVDDLVAYLETL